MSTLDDLLALLPDNNTGKIDAADLRTIVTALHSDTDDLASRVTMLEAEANTTVVTGAWQFSTAAPPPTGSQVRMDNADQALATAIVFRLTDSDGLDRTAFFSTASISKIRLQDWDDSSVYHAYLVSGTPTMSANTATLNVAHENGNGVLSSQKVRVLFMAVLG